MPDTFHKFPHTPHLLWLGHGAPRDDKVLASSEVAEFLSAEVLVEEKVDGANLGISLTPDGRLRAQSRGNYLAPGKSHAQWNLLWPWLGQRQAALEDGLRGDLILFGEWCYARHSVSYDTLPDWFLAFDIFEIQSKRFWSVERRNQWTKDRDIVPVPQLRRGRFQKNQLPALMGQSKVGHVPMEGIYLRREQAGYLEARAKLVSVAFEQQIEEHWTRRALVPNHLAPVHVRMAR
jgi:RNA ligase-like protein